MSQSLGYARDDLDALLAAAERAGRALGCVYSCSEEYEAAFLMRIDPAPLHKAVSRAATLALAVILLFV